MSKASKLTKNVTILNVLSSILLQMVSVISGFIIPRVILSVFDSEVNGLVSSLSQFLNYVSLLEGGLGGVVAANLYRPLYNKDSAKISSIVKTTQNFYRKIAYLFIAYTLAVAVIYPLVVSSSFSFAYIFSLTVILAITLFIQYNFSLAQRLLLQADKKVYIVSFTQIVITILNVSIFVIASKLCPSIHVLKLISALVFVLQPIIYNHFVKKYYQLDKQAPIDSALLSSRWDGFAINVAAFIHNNTDVTVLTLFTNLKSVSVYAVYALVTSGIKKVIQAISSGVGPTIGHLYASGDKEALNRRFDLYEYVTFFITFFLFTLGGLIITPFVKFYTHGIMDADYDQALFGALLIVSELIYCIRDPYVALAYSANRFKDIRKHAYIEASLNILLSVVLVKFFGLVGVAIGTIIAMSYRTTYHVFYLKKHILHRSPKTFFSKFLSFSIVSAFSIVLSLRFFPIHKYTIINVVLGAITYSIIILSTYLVVSLIFYRDRLADFLKKLRR